jgi:hypothetical protein
MNKEKMAELQEMADAVREAEDEMAKASGDYYRKYGETYSARYTPMEDLLHARAL